MFLLTISAAVYPVSCSAALLKLVIFPSVSVEMIEKAVVLMIDSCSLNASARAFKKRSCCPVFVATEFFCNGSILDAANLMFLKTV